MDAGMLTIHEAPTRAGAIRLLESAGLPASDITDEGMSAFLYVGSAHAPDALVGLEIYGADALLRSLVVAPTLRVRGVGTQLVAKAESFARARGVSTLYLLTTTAEKFFRDRGYVDVPRSAAPARIRSTEEFAGLCPASSAFLSKVL